MLIIMHATEVVLFVELGENEVFRHMKTCTSLKKSVINFVEGFAVQNCFVFLQFGI